MWGTHPNITQGGLMARFIPTHVGNTPLLIAADIKLTVHPHACGEHVTGGFTGSSGTGSSPRMWGTP